MIIDDDYADWIHALDGFGRTINKYLPVFFMIIVIRGGIDVELHESYFRNCIKVVNGTPVNSLNSFTLEKLPFFLFVFLT